MRIRIEGEVRYRLRNVGPAWLPSWIRRAITFALPWEREPINAEIPVANGMILPLSSGFSLSVHKGYSEIRHGGKQLWRHIHKAVWLPIKVEPVKGVILDVFLEVSDG